MSEYEGGECHQQHAENEYESLVKERLVNCPKHGWHEHAIVSNIEGHVGAWCQLCWLESLGPGLPVRIKI